MFTVEITDGAKVVLEVKLREFGRAHSGVVIYREGPKGDVSRSKDGVRSGILSAQGTRGFST